MSCHVVAFFTFRWSVVSAVLCTSCMCHLGYLQLCNMCLACGFHETSRGARHPRGRCAPHSHTAHLTFPHERGVTVQEIGKVGSRRGALRRRCLSREAIGVMGRGERLLR